MEDYIFEGDYSEVFEALTGNIDDELEEKGIIDGFANSLRCEQG